MNNFSYNRLPNTLYHDNGSQKDGFEDLADLLFFIRYMEPDGRFDIFSDNVFQFIITKENNYYLTIEIGNAMLAGSYQS